MKLALNYQSAKMLIESKTLTDIIIFAKELGYQLTIDNLIAGLKDIKIKTSDQKMDKGLSLEEALRIFKNVASQTGNLGLSDTGELSEDDMAHFKMAVSRYNLILNLISNLVKTLSS
jgi:hypothetical protein